MTSYNATVKFFSQLCLFQLEQPLSAHDAANYGFGAALVRTLFLAYYLAIRGMTT
jgi:hypothetical protein